MRRMPTLGVVLVVALFTGSLAAQEAVLAEELLKWFPQGRYMRVSHRDDIRLAQGDAFELYQKYFEPATPEEEESNKSTGKNEPKGGFSFVPRGVANISAGRVLPKDRLRLPPSLKKDLYAVTTASALSLIDEPLEGSDRTQAVTIESVDGKSGPKIGIFIKEGDSMAVYRYNDLDGAIATALEKNELAKIGARLGGRLIYSFSLAETGQRSADLFAWASETGELLVAADRKTLRKMYLAGHGLMSTLMDEPSYVDLASIVPELGAKWSLMILQDLSQQMADSLEDRGLDEQLEEMRERQSSSPTIQIESLEIGERLISRSYKIFAESDAAEAAMSKADQEGAPQMANAQPWNEYQLLMKERKRTELRDNMVVTTIEIDEKLLKAEAEANAAMQQQLMKGGKVTINGPDGEKMELEVKDSKDGKNITIMKKKK